MSAPVLRRVLAALRWYTLREKAFVAATWTALRVLPSRPVAVVHGFPDSEGNAVEVVRGLLRRYPGTVYWLHNKDQPGPPMALADAAPAGRLVLARVNSVPAFLAAWRAEVTFFTHGLMTAVRPPRSRLVVNLWHGDGPKQVPGLPRCASTVAVAATRLWAAEKARLFRLPLDRVAVVGNPRVDSAFDRSPEETRRLLGLEGDARVVLWLPTFRHGSDGVRVTWSEGDPLSASLGGAIAVPDGVRLLVKPHPLDTDDYSGLGATVVGNDDLARSGITLMQLLAASDALLSDASSAWVDYLTFDRPVGFFLPDLDRYGEARGYNVPDLLAVLPGPVLHDPSEVGGFLADVCGDRLPAPSTYAAASAVGYTADLPVTDHLFDWLDDFQRARGRRPLFAAVEPA